MSQTDTSVNNKRIAKNALYMYVRMVVVMLTTLYTSRIVLEQLGVEDFGIYTVVGGIIVMFRILNGALTDASQRFITFELGKGKKGDVNKIFSQCLILHIILGLIVVAVAEPVGIWFLNNKLQIPPERLNAAFWIYQFTIISMFVMFISVPYNALIVAHEKMSAFAVISIIDAFLRLVIAYALSIKGVDKLILYGALILVSQIILRLIYTIYCRKKIEESTFKFTLDIKTISQMGSFASWTILGNVAYLCTTQGLNLLLGMFFSPIVNAARGIAVQVQGAIETFVRNFQTAINPQITKNYASHNIEAMQKLVFTSSRFSFYLMMLPIIPLLFETEQILKIWLGQVPEYAINFTRVVLLISLVTTLLNPLEVSVKASGKIRNFELIVYGLKLFVLPVAYILLQQGASPLSVFLIQLLFEVVAFVVSIVVTSSNVGFLVLKYIKNVLFVILPVAVLSMIVPIVLVQIIEGTLGRFILLTLLSSIWSLIIVVFLGTTKEEKLFIKNKILCLGQI